jgi:hypothetical protein
LFSHRSRTDADADAGHPSFVNSRVMLCGFDPVLTSATTQTGDTDADEDNDDGGEEE